MSCSTQENTLTIKELEVQLEEARKSLVDKKYVGYEEQGHLFNYDIDFSRFLIDISHILEEIKKLPTNSDNSNDKYKKA